MKLFFIPGRKWALSLAELRSVLKTRSIKNVEIHTNENFFLYDILLKVDQLTELFNSLGGFIKFGFVVDDVYSYLEENALKSAKKLDKVLFSTSSYGSEKNKKNVIAEKDAQAMEIKRWLKTKNVKSRYVANPSQTDTSAVLIQKNSIIEDGFDVCYLFHPKKKTTLYGFTLAVQDFEGFSKRDYERPRSNKGKGMIPPKLARIMLNLSGVSEGKTIWDPFCGSGTILQEALLMGYRIIGSDIDGQAISESKENLTWLCEEYKISHTMYNLFTYDLSRGLPENIFFDAIVTEPYLGPVQKKSLSVDKVEELTAKLDPIYNSFDKIASSDTKKAGKKRMVVVIPGFKTFQGWIDMEPLFTASGGIKDVTSTIIEYPLQWDRPHSIIRRNIKIFEY